MRCNEEKDEDEDVVKCVIKKEVACIVPIPAEYNEPRSTTHGDVKVWLYDVVAAETKECRVLIYSMFIYIFTL